MAAPLSRLGQITQAETLINTNTNQDISALDVRNTLSGIIDSTTGMKTIWVGNFKSTFALSVITLLGSGKIFSSATRTGVRLVETYADPYFFPPATAKYLITNAGSGIQGSSTQKNIPTSLVLPSGAVGAIYRFGGGLTFDCVVNTTSLTLSSVSVANPGSGYSSLLLASSDPGWGIVELNFPLFATKPVVKIQLNTVVAGKVGDSNNGLAGGTTTNAIFDNVFCFNSPNIATALYVPNGANNLEAIQATAIPIPNYPESIMTHSVTTGGAYTSTGESYMNANNVTGFNLNIRNGFDVNDFLNGAHTVVTSVQIEIKVPIINTTF